MSTDIYVYSAAAGLIDAAVLSRAADADGWELTLRRNRGETMPGAQAFVVTAAADFHALLGGNAEAAKVTFDLYVTPIDEEDRKDFPDLVADLSSRGKSIAKKCVQKYYLEGEMPSGEGLLLMERLAWLIAAQAGGIVDDPQGVEPRAFAAGAKLPRWNKEPTLREQVGPIGVRVVEWCQQHGYTIPPAFFNRGACYQYVALITSFTPPKLNAVSFSWPTQLVTFLSAPPAGYVYRAFDFEAEQEIVADPAGLDGLRPIGPIPGLKPAPRKQKGRRG